MTFQRRNSVELQALLDDCPKCGVSAGVWCKTRYGKFAPVVHAARKAEAADQVSITELRAQVRRDAAHAAGRAAMSDPEGMAP